MVQQSFLLPIVDAAARLGEEVLSARVAQKAFEARSVHKFVFAVTPVHRDDAVSAATNGESGGGRGLAVLPELGQVVSVTGKSTLTCHRETSPLPYLRRSFLTIGSRAAWGEVSTKKKERPEIGGLNRFSSALPINIYLAFHSKSKYFRPNTGV